MQFNNDMLVGEGIGGLLGLASAAISSTVGNVMSSTAVSNPAWLALFAFGVLLMLASFATLLFSLGHRHGRHGNAGASGSQTSIDLRGALFDLRGAHIEVHAPGPQVTSSPTELDEEQVLQVLQGPYGPRPRGARSR